MASLYKVLFCTSRIVPGSMYEALFVYMDIPKVTYNNHFAATFAWLFLTDAELLAVPYIIHT